MPVLNEHCVKNNYFLCHNKFYRPHKAVAVWEYSTDVFVKCNWFMAH